MVAVAAATAAPVASAATEAQPLIVYTLSRGYLLSIITRSQPKKINDI